MYFLVQIKRKNGTVEKGVVVKNSLDEAKQSYHSYLGAYAYGHEEGTDYVLVHILDENGLGLVGEVWKAEEVANAE
jgi:hypothetical protein